MLNTMGLKILMAGSHCLTSYSLAKLNNNEQTMNKKKQKKAHKSDFFAIPVFK